MRTMIILCAIAASLSAASSCAQLVNIGDQEVFELDANLNLSVFRGGTPISIDFTAGEYELKFLDTNPDRTAWNAWSEAGWDYWVGHIRIAEEGYYEDHLLFDGIESFGVGNTQAEAYADAAANSALIHQFTVSQDIIGDAFVTDVDRNNIGGLTIQITKVIPEPSSVSLIALIGAGGYAIRRRFLI